jgi:hypothetical protein
MAETACGAGLIISVALMNACGVSAKASPLRKGFAHYDPLS